MEKHIPRKRSKVKRKEERKQRRSMYVLSMNRGERVHIVMWCVFGVWLLLAVLLLLLLLYGK